MGIYSYFELLILQVKVILPANFFHLANSFPLAKDLSRATLTVC
jgi:hypothetical protein